MDTHLFDHMSMSADIPPCTTCQQLHRKLANKAWYAGAPPSSSSDVDKPQRILRPRTLRTKANSRTVVSGSDDETQIESQLTQKDTSQLESTRTGDKQLPPELVEPVKKKKGRPPRSSGNTEATQPKQSKHVKASRRR